MQGAAAGLKQQAVQQRGARGRGKGPSPDDPIEETAPEAGEEEGKLTPSWMHEQEEEQVGADCGGVVGMGEGCAAVEKSGTG